MTKRALTTGLMAGFCMAATGCTMTNALTSDFDPDDLDMQDPFEAENRAVYAFNDTVDEYALEPISRTYVYATPEPARDCATNVFSNLKEPARAFSHAVALDGQGVANSVTRFFFNTVVGGLGCFDVAEESMLIGKRETDLGLVARSYLDNENSVYVMLPLFGPTTIIDGTTDAFTSRYLDPLDATQPRKDPQLLNSDLDDANPYSLHDDGTRTWVAVIGGINTRANLLEATDLVDEVALDPYSFIRDAYLERRAALAEEIR